MMELKQVVTMYQAGEIIALESSVTTACMCNGNVID
jgi:hypothetical protein